ncbi:IS3 family transposase [Peribacillus sp. NJ11]|uniref:IS3 family transposase n=1 Tax=Peribacillus sp. NJ11 TaxID=3055861 RepID=UPI0025A0B648|nr:IS3 family transposase [Peribacillus sp. NJ11]MDM5224581.1 IS3 family transposase [Peribacillus sp. NJ11]
MSKIIFNESQMKRLENNPHVKQVSERSIAYHPDFKVKAVKENQAGKSTTQIFIEHGFDLEMIGSDKQKGCLKRWRKIFEQYGGGGFYTERRGKGSGGRPKSKSDTQENPLKKAEARIKYLEAELGIPKKARRTRKAGIEEEKITKSEIFMLQIIRRYSLTNMVSYFCEMAEVSRSGYYAWLQAESIRFTLEEKDWQDYELIHKVFEGKKKAGALNIKMIVENDFFVTMNHKKIRRLMNKFNLKARIRQANPYKKMAKATHEHKVVPNLLNRKFNQGEPRKTFLTDITYVYWGSGLPAYLSCVKDAVTREIVVYHLSRSLKMDIVYRTLEKLADSLDELLHPEAMIHSDQGVHYTHPEFQRRVKKLGLIQSMSRKGNCWDNAPMESFFDHFKDEVDYSVCQTFEELHLIIEEYIEEYNTNRYQWSF